MDSSHLACIQERRAEWLRQDLPFWLRECAPAVVAKIDSEIAMIKNHSGGQTDGQD